MSREVPRSQGPDRVIQARSMYENHRLLVGVYGAINLRTDGETAVLAFRKENSSPKSRWFYYELHRDASGAFFPELKGH